MLTRCRFVLEVCWRCAGVAPLQHAPMSDPSSTTPTPLRHAPPGTLIFLLSALRCSLVHTVCPNPADTPLLRVARLGLVLPLRARYGALVLSSSIGTLWTTLSQKGLAARRAYGVCRPYVLCAAGSGLSLPRCSWRDAGGSNASWIIAPNGEDTPSARARLERPSRATARSARKSRSRATPIRCRAPAGGIFCAQAVEGLDSKLPSQCTPSRCPRGRAAGTLVHGHEGIDSAAAAK